MTAVTLLVEYKVLISTISGKGNSGNTKSREHGFKVGGLCENGRLAPGFTFGPRIVVDWYLYL